MSPKKQKNYIILLSGIFIFQSIKNDIHAQTQTQGQVNVSVILNDFIEISAMNIMEQSIVFNIACVDNYISGISRAIPNNLVISSSREFNLMARAAYANFTAGTYRSFPSDVLSIEVENRDISGIGLLIRPIEGLELNDQPLITKASAVIRKYINVTYKISSSKIKEEILGKDPGNYNNTVIFTLSTF